jgi:hypothetical protein
MSPSKSLIPDKRNFYFALVCLICFLSNPANSEALSLNENSNVYHLTRKMCEDSKNGLGNLRTFAHFFKFGMPDVLKNPISWTKPSLKTEILFANPQYKRALKDCFNSNEPEINRFNLALVDYEFLGRLSTPVMIVSLQALTTAGSQKFCSLILKRTSLVKNYPRTANILKVTAVTASIFGTATAAILLGHLIYFKNQLRKVQETPSLLVPMDSHYTHDAEMRDRAIFQRQLDVILEKIKITRDPRELERLLKNKKIMEKLLED